MADFLTFDPDDKESVEPVINRLRRFAISRCDGDVESAKEILQEAVFRLYKAKPWKRKECSTHDGVLAYGTVVVKNILYKEFAKQERRDALRSQLEERFGKPLDPLASVEARMCKESFVKALRRVPAFAGSNEAQSFIEYEFVDLDNLTHEEIAEKMGFTSRQLTKFKRKFYDAIPQELIDRFVGRRRPKSKKQL